MYFSSFSFFLQFIYLFFFFVVHSVNNEKGGQLLFSPPLPSSSYFAVTYWSRGLFALLNTWPGVHSIGMQSYLPLSSPSIVYISIYLLYLYVVVYVEGAERNGSRSLILDVCVCVCVALFFSVFVIFSFALLFSQFVELHVSFSFSISLSPSPIMYTSRAGKLFCNSRSSSSVGCPAGGALQSVERATERGAPAQVGGAETTSKRKRFDSLSLFCFFFRWLSLCPLFLLPPILNTDFCVRVIACVIHLNICVWKTKTKIQIGVGNAKVS